MRTAVLALALLLVVAACGTDGFGRQPYTEADSGEQISLESGAEFEIELESNPSTGYGWAITTESMPDFLSLVEGRYDPPDSDLVGAPGTELFHFKVTSEGSGILRLEYIRPFDDPVIPLRIVEYILQIGAGGSASSTVMPGTTSASAPPITASPTTGPPPALSVSALLDGESETTVLVSGFLVEEGGTTRLCDALAESFPPQCGSDRVVVANPDSIDVDWSQAQGVRWTDQRVEVLGDFDGQQLVLSTGG